MNSTNPAMKSLYIHLKCFIKVESHLSFVYKSQFKINIKAVETTLTLLTTEILNRNEKKIIILNLVGLCHAIAV